jgi:hypothetical protein
MRHTNRVIRIAVLPTAHLLLCAYIAVSDNIWNWMLLSAVDLPLVYLQKYVGDRYGLFLIGPLGLTILGTAWWLCIGTALSYIFERLTRKRNPKAP